MRPTSMRFVLFSLVVAAFAATPGSIVAQELSIGARAANLTVGGRVHAQYQASSVETADNSFFIRRARLLVDAELNDFFSGRVQADFAGGGAELLDAYVRLDFTDDVSLYGGQFKRSFDLFELASSTDLSIIERDGRVAGYSECTGVGSICSYSRLLEALGYAGRDTGLKIEGGSGSVALQASLTNGTGVGSPDENDAKSFAGRASLSVADNVVVSANVGVRDYLDSVDESANAIAWGGDVQVGTWRDGLLLQGAVVTGDNWLSRDGSDDPATFTTLQLSASYYMPLESARFAGLEPVGRVSVSDPDGDTDEDGGTLLTPGLMLYVTGRNKIGVNLDYYIPQTGDDVYSVKFQAFLYF